MENRVRIAQAHPEDGDTLAAARYGLAIDWQRIAVTSGSSRNVAGSTREKPSAAHRVPFQVPPSQ